MSDWLFEAAPSIEPGMDLALVAGGGPMRRETTMTLDDWAFSPGQRSSLESDSE